MLMHVSTDFIDFFCTLLGYSNKNIVHLYTLLSLSSPQNVNKGQMSDNDLSGGWFVSRISQKQLNAFPRNLGGGWVLAQNRPH